MMSTFDFYVYFVVQTRLAPLGLQTFTTPLLGVACRLGCSLNPVPIGGWLFSILYLMRAESCPRIKRLLDLLA